MTDPLTGRQHAWLKQMANSGYLPTIEKWARELTAPFYWDEPEEREARRRKGGTMCFVHTGSQLIGVTAGHIHATIAERLRDGRSRWCQIGGHTFQPRERLIDFDLKMDLATYELSEIQVNAARANIHYARTWPPGVSEADAYIVGGWPWELSERGVRRSTHYFLHFIARLSSASPSNLGIVTATSKSIPWGRNSLPPGTNLGGMSGGPVYGVSEQGLSMLSLVGIVYEYQPGFEIAFARPLSLVNADGSLRREIP
jgi:hypothetical protein